jgi:hypothetical protein
MNFLTHNLLPLLLASLLLLPTLTLLACVRSLAGLLLLTSRFLLANLLLLASLLFASPSLLYLLVTLLASSEISNLRSEISNQKSKIKNATAQSSDLTFFFEAFLATALSEVSDFFVFASALGAVRLARGAAAAPPRLRLLLSTSFAGFTPALLPAPSPLLTFASGLGSFVNETVT